MGEPNAAGRLVAMLASGTAGHEELLLTLREQGGVVEGQRAARGLSPGWLGCPSRMHVLFDAGPWRHRLLERPRPLDAGTVA